MTENSPLRQRMIDDMTIRNLSPATHDLTFMRCKGSAVILAVRRIVWFWSMCGPIKSTLLGAVYPGAV